MKPVLSLLTIICLVVPTAGQVVDPTATDPTVMALTSLLPLKQQAKFGTFLKSNNEQAKFAGFLDTQGRFALLAGKETLLHVRAEAERPNYGGNAAAKTRNNIWRSFIEGKVVSSTTMLAKPKD